MDMNLLAGIAILLLLAIVGIAILTRRRRSEHLAHRFGPEYERTVEQMGSRGQAESELAAREKRVKKFDIVPLATGEAQRFRTEWQALQSRFVDNPQAAVGSADMLVRDLMMRRGYPVGDFESLAADLSVDHPVVVEHYRAAHAIALRQERGEADTEALRQAVVHYRALFAELLEVDDPKAVAQRRAADERELHKRRRAGFLHPDRAMAKEEGGARERDRRNER
jgi:hypothetical protein